LQLFTMVVKFSIIKKLNNKFICVIYFLSVVNESSKNTSILRYFR
jgi:hypothetical protein